LARKQWMVTQRMRADLLALHYTATEVAAIDPEVAAVVIGRGLARPRMGMPPAWKRRGSKLGLGRDQGPLARALSGVFKALNPLPFIRSVGLAAARSLSVLGITPQRVGAVAAALAKALAVGFAVAKLRSAMAGGGSSSGGFTFPRLPSLPRWGKPSGNSDLDDDDDGDYF
jgi:hypothetical protein